MQDRVMRQRVFGRVREVLPVPDLCALQLESYDRLLQLGVPRHRRTSVGLEAILQEVFPIESFDGTVRLEYVSYDLAQPRFPVRECRRLRLTYGMPFKLRVRLVYPGNEAIEEDVYVGDIPRMVGGGEFIIHGAQRVIVAQLHRSPGVDFSVDYVAGEIGRAKARIIPERGAWIELEIDKKDTVRVRVDKSGKFPVTSLLRCFGEGFGTDADLLRLFYETEVVQLSSRRALDRIQQRVSVEDICDPESGEVLAEAGEAISPEAATAIREAGVRRVEVVIEIDTPYMQNTVREDPSESADDALTRFYARLRPGYPPDTEKAQALFTDRFENPQRYSLGRVGRFRFNRKLGFETADLQDPSAMLLTARDLVAVVRYLVRLQAGDGEVDDIDHLGNRRVRTVDELFREELRRGFLRMKRTCQERLSLLDDKKLEGATPRTLLHYKVVSNTIDAFFGRGELSQIVDQTNPLSQLTHERRLSALGPGGLNRKRAGFEVRDVHVSHYGRICPIETPEGANIGLIASLSIYAKLDDFGFLVTPFRVFTRGRFTGEVVYLRADEEEGRVIAPADTPVDQEGRIEPEFVISRHKEEFSRVAREEIELMDLSPKQMVSLSAALIPFLEHDDANRALMGSNMQRQAVPLLIPEPPVVATGMETAVARNSALVVRAERAGTVRRASATEIVVDDLRYPLSKFEALSEKTCQNQRPCVRVGDRVERGAVIADGASTVRGELALGRNVFVAFMTFDGYNFEDAILVSERLVRDDCFTSVHLEEFEIEVRETDIGREELTPDIPNVPRRALRHLDPGGVVKTGSTVRPGDVLVGKVAPKAKTELSAEEKLLRAIFGRMGEDVKNESLTVPPGVEGVVIEAVRFERKTHLSDDERGALEEQVEGVRSRAEAQLRLESEALVSALEALLGGPVLLEGGAIRLHPDDLVSMSVRELRAQLSEGRAVCPKALLDRFLEVVDRIARRFEAIEVERNRTTDRLTKGHELPPGVLELVKVYVATKREITVGDKMAGRHGNKGVVARVLAIEDMPHLKDGTPVDMCLNPLGVPSRMNVGQILETHLGWAAHTLGLQAVTPIFDGTTEAEIGDLLEEAGLPRSGKVQLYDGRTGEPFGQETTVGYMYMLKLHHMVNDKIHARATGPYSLITQQPLGGKARFGGQRFGEMEVWALEAYGAANILQELLTVKSDDVDGRAKIYESMVKGRNVLEPGTPVSFHVLTQEIKGLCLNMELETVARAAGSPEARSGAAPRRAAVAAREGTVQD